MPPGLGCASCPNVVAPVPFGEVAEDGTGATGRAGGVSDRVEELANATTGRTELSIANTGPIIPFLDIIISL